MHKTLLALPCAIALMAATAEPTLAAVNCGMVKKDLDRGKKADDIALNMGVSVKDVETCKNTTGNTATIDTSKDKAAQPDTTPKGVTPPGVNTQGK